MLATLLRLFEGDLDLAEEALHEAFAIALEQWPVHGVPGNPYAWLVSAGKFRAIDAVRRNQRGRELLLENFGTSVSETPSAAGGITPGSYASFQQAPSPEKHLIEDDQLRLVFYCCHPALPLDARIALALREVCGMRTEEIARAYLISVEAIKKRISRAKATIKEQRIAYEIPTSAELGPRMSAVLHVVYLIYNEGYCASAGETHLREELCEEGLYLARQLVELVPTSESLGLLALLLLQESRRAARTNDEGDIVALADQDRGLWNGELIRAGVELLYESAAFCGRPGPYSLQAAIAAVHARAESVEATAWNAIVEYYDLLLEIQKGPVIEMNRAIAFGMHAGPEAGLAILERLDGDGAGALADYHLLHAARAEFLKRLGRVPEAVQAYEQALALVRQEPEARYLRRQLAALAS